MCYLDRLSQEVFQLRYNIVREKVHAHVLTYGFSQPVIVSSSITVVIKVEGILKKELKINVFFCSLGSIFSLVSTFEREKKV